jgi:hypothetical protein
MTSVPMTNNAMDHRDQLSANAFDGDTVPTCPVEFLLGRYCASTDPAEIDEGR